MIDKSTCGTLIKIFFIFAFLASVTLNFFQSRVVNHQEMAIEHLFKYKKGFIKLMGVLQVPVKEAERFLDSSGQDKD